MAWYWTMTLSDERASVVSLIQRFTISPLPFEQRCYRKGGMEGGVNLLVIVESG